MKPLVTETDIKNIANSGKKAIYLEPGTLVTPSAKDVCREKGISIVFGTAPAEEKCCREEVNVAEPTGGAISPELISKIVMEVMANLPQCGAGQQMVKECDPSGIRRVQGSSVVCEEFKTGNPNDKVGLTEILNRRESPNMATGFMTLDHSAFDWHLMYEEIDYVVEGTLDIIINGKTYRGHAGDVLYIPRDSKITFSTPDKCRFFFVTYPANWAELSGEQVQK